jgi:hypothetical protein
MRIAVIVFIAVLIVVCGCQRQNVKVTIAYDKNPVNAYPYVSFSDVATIYYTVGIESFSQPVTNHKSIQIVVPEKTQLRASYEKYTSDAGGTTTTTASEFYTADTKNPHWKF